MKKILITVIALVPLFCVAQTVKTLTPEQKLEQAQKQLEEAKKAVETARANAQKAQKEAEAAKARAKDEQEKLLAAKQAAIREQTKKLLEEADRLNKEAEKINAETKKLNIDSEKTAETTADKKNDKVVITSDQTKMVKNELASPKIETTSEKDSEIQYSNVNGWSAVAPSKVAAAQVKKEVAVEDTGKYMVGAVPVVNGKVVFTLDYDVPGMTAEDMYKKIFDYVGQLTVDAQQNTSTKRKSKIAIVNMDTHSIAAQMYEWLVFSNSFLASDKTEFNYTLIVNCSDGHLNAKIERISYAYETNRSTGFILSAHEVITDKMALNKKQTKVVRPYGKFRCKTIDRKDEIFAGMIGALNGK